MEAIVTTRLNNDNDVGRSSNNTISTVLNSNSSKVVTYDGCNRVNGSVIYIKTPFYLALVLPQALFLLPSNILLTINIIDL